MLHLGTVVVGLASFVVFVSNWFELIRWIGVEYLLYLGIRAWMDSFGNEAPDASEVADSIGHRDFIDGFLVTQTKPKAMLFLGAFLPQFIDSSMPALPQLFKLTITYLVVVATLDSCWAVLTVTLKNLPSKGVTRRVLDLLSVTLLIGAGAALASVRQTNQ